MMQLNTYLVFDGETEAAMTFYQSVFGGEFAEVMRYKDMPAEFVSDSQMDEEQANRIMHMTLVINENNALLANDNCRRMGEIVKGTQYSISIRPDSEEDAKRIYEQLSKGGDIHMPLEVQFWGSLFASFKDQYGIEWLIDYPMS